MRCLQRKKYPQGKVHFKEREAGSVASREEVSGWARVICLLSGVVSDVK